MKVKTNFVLPIVAVVIAIVGCILAIRVSFFQPAPVSEERLSAMIEEKTRTYVTEESVKKIVEEAIAALKPSAPRAEEKE